MYPKFVLTSVFLICTPIYMVGHYFGHFQAVGYHEILSAVLALSSLERSKATY